MKKTHNKLDALLDRLFEDESLHQIAFYQRAIEIHENQKLRLLAKRANCFYIEYSGNYPRSDLLYTKDGFEQYTKKCVDNQYDCGVHYEQDTKVLFYVKDNTLISYDGNKTKLFLEIFPDMTIKKIESVLEKAIKKLEAKRK